MRIGIPSLLMLAVLAVGLVQSGNYGQRAAQPQKSRVPRRQVEVRATTAEGRLIAHALGQTWVPHEPRRIVSLSAAVTDSLVALGITPVLVESAWQSDRPAPYLAAGLRGAAAVRRAGGISLEAVLDARPDLILLSSAQDARLYGQMSQIAPTVVFAPTTSGDRETVLLDVGDVLGLSARAAERLAAYRQRLQRAKAALAATAGSQPVVFLRFRRQTCVIYAQTLMFGPLLFDQLGLTPDPAMPLTMSPGGWDVLTIEGLSTLRPAHIFLVIDNDSESYFGYVAGTPIWKSLPAVRDGQVHEVAATTWLGGDGVLAGEAIIDDVLAALAPEANR